MSSDLTEDVNDFLVEEETDKPVSFDGVTSSYLAGPEDHPLWPIRAKIARADYHLYVLGKEIEAFLNRKPYDVASEADDQAGEYFWRVSIREAPDPRWGLLASEVAHHLNSALDHIVWLIASQRPGGPPKGTGFPVFPSAKGFRQLWSRNGGYFSIRGLPAQAQAIIEDEQPYHRGNAYKGHPLWVLRGLANADKHETLVVVGGAAGKGTVKVSQKGGEIPVKPVKFINGPFKDGDVIGRWPLPAAGPQGMEIQLDVGFAFHVAFTESSPARSREVLRALVEMRNTLNIIVNRLAPFVA